MYAANVLFQGNVKRKGTTPCFRVDWMCIRVKEMGRELGKQLLWLVDEMA